MWCKPRLRKPQLEQPSDSYSMPMLLDVSEALEGAFSTDDALRRPVPDLDALSKPVPELRSIVLSPPR
ncbi:hypothetical protein JCM10599A_57010 [Paraburkholderia kururiensis]